MEEYGFLELDKYIKYFRLMLQEISTTHMSTIINKQQKQEKDVLSTQKGDDVYDSAIFMVVVQQALQGHFESPHHR